MEPEVLEKATRRDVKEFQVQVAARLLFDCERQIKEEHKRQASRVNQNVDLQIARYKREIQEEEQSIILERRKWLMDRIVAQLPSATFFFWGGGTGEGKVSL